MSLNVFGNLGPVVQNYQDNFIAKNITIINVLSTVRLNKSRLMTS